jgi:hypothetical protein
MPASAAVRRPRRRAHPADARNSQVSTARMAANRWVSGTHQLANARSKVAAETTAQLVWILAARLPEPTEDDATQTAASAV